MLDIISNGRLNLGAARGATMQEMALCGVDPETTTAQVKEASLHRALLAGGLDRVGQRPAADPPAGRPPQSHGRAPAGTVPASASGQVTPISL